MQGSNLRPLACKASALPAELILQKNGDPYGTRTRDTAVKGRCLNRLTNGPCNYYVEKIMFLINFLKYLSETNESYYIQIKNICKWLYTFSFKYIYFIIIYLSKKLII